MSDEVNIDEVDTDVDEDEVRTPADITGPGPTDNLSSLDEVHEQAAVNRAASPGQVGNDPTIVTAGEAAVPPPPGPGPAEQPTAEALAVQSVATPLLTSTGEPINPEDLAINNPPDEEYEEYDPGAYTVAEVNEYIAAHPDEADAIIAAEQAGKNRAGIVG